MSKMMDLFAAAVAVGGTPLAADGAPLAEALGFGGVSTDSRAVAAGGAVSTGATTSPIGVVGSGGGAVASRRDMK